MVKYNMKYLWLEKGGYANKKARSYLAEEFDPNKIKKIAVIRHAALGDQVITRPFLIELRKFFPEAEITLSGVTNYQYGAPTDLVDSVHWVYGRHKNSETSIFERLQRFRSLGRQDIIFDLAATNRSYWTAFFNDAKIKVGFPYKGFLNGLLYDLSVFRSDQNPEIETMLNMLRIFGCTPEYPLDFGFPSNLNNIKKIKRVVYFNGASQERKMYPVELQNKLMRIGVEVLPEYQHVYLEGLSANEKSDPYNDLMKIDNFAVQESMNLDELTGYLADSAVVVSTDTGIRNLAISTHTPTVGIFNTTVPFRYTPMNERHRIAISPDADQPEPAYIAGILKELAESTQR